MTTIERYTDLAIPSWSLPYIINNDRDNFTPEEIDLIDRWRHEYAAWPLHFLLSVEGEEFFTWHPEFGPGANCVRGTLVIARAEEPLSDPNEEPDHDDTVHCCPDCEQPNQFGELCPRCQHDRQVEIEAES